MCSAASLLGDGKNICSMMYSLNPIKNANLQQANATSGSNCLFS